MKYNCRYLYALNKNKTQKFKVEFWSITFLSVMWSEKIKIQKNSKHYHTNLSAALVTTYIVFFQEVVWFCVENSLL